MSNRKCNTATSRLKQDYLRLKKDPVPYVVAEPLPTNILEWHYVVSGPDNSPYEGGMYHGKLVFPREFPFKPPSIYMLTPNGRFKTNTRLCLSISDFHPDSWNPAWSVSTILTGLLSFMLEKSPTYGSIETSDFEKRQLAYQSISFNLRDSQFCEQFPDLVEKSRTEVERRERGVLVSGGGAILMSGGLLVGGGGGGGANRRSATNQEQGGGVGGGQPSSLASALTNLCVFVGVAAFAYAVKYVVGTTAAE